MHRGYPTVKNTLRQSSRVRQSQRDRTKGEAMTTPHPKNKAENQKELWALALAAPLFEMNGYQHEYLYGGANKAEMANCCGNLESSWSIRTSDDLMQTLEWLETSGHRSDFWRIHSFLLTLSEQGCARYMASFRQNKDHYEQLKLVNYYKLPLKGAGISAWDIHRYVFLCRMGCVLDLINEEKAWDLILQLAPKAQQMFTGWRQYCLSWAAGRQFWLSNSDVDLADQIRPVVSALLAHPDSIWRDLDWHTILED